MFVAVALPNIAEFAYKFVVLALPAIKFVVLALVITAFVVVELPIIKSVIFAIAATKFAKKPLVDDAFKVVLFTA